LDKAELLGWKIFLHSFRMIFWNRKVALRLVMPMFLVLMLISVLAIPDGGLIYLINVLLIIAFVVALVWAAVGWLRFVLLEETPSANSLVSHMMPMWQ